MPHYDIVALGEPLIEFNQTAPGEPRFLQGYGGDTSNATIAAARQGARCAYLTRVGDDAFGAQFRALWRAEGVDNASVLTDAQTHTDRKSTRLNSSHLGISYAVFCLKKKKT